MYKQQFHDSGIVDEGLSDEEESNQPENYTGKTNEEMRDWMNSKSACR